MPVVRHACITNVHQPAQGRSRARTFRVPPPLPPRYRLSADNVSLTIRAGPRPAPGGCVRGTDCTPACDCCAQVLASLRLTAHRAHESATSGSVPVLLREQWCNRCTCATVGPAQPRQQYSVVPLLKGGLPARKHALRAARMTRSRLLRSPSGAVNFDSAERPRKAAAYCNGAR